MPWIIHFVISWALFFVLIDYSRLKYNIFGGIFAFVVSLCVDIEAQKFGLYGFENLVLPFLGFSLFYKFGTVLTMGTLIAQFMPYKKWMQVLNILVLTFLFLATEYLFLQTHVLVYRHWDMTASFLVDIAAFVSLSWFTLTFLREANHRQLRDK